MQCFILAGGFATRLWPLTEKRAKPLLPLAGIPLLTHLVEKIPPHIPITISTNAIFADDFAQWKKQLSIINCQLSIVIEDTGSDDQKLGALGAVRKWILEERIEDDILLLAGDNYMGFSIAALLGKYDGKPLLATFDIGELAKAHKFGTVLTEDAPNPQTGTFRVTGFEEKPAEPKSTLVSTGCTVIPMTALQRLVDYAEEHPDNIGGIFEHFLQNGVEVACAPFADPWFDIGSFEAYVEATKALIGTQVLRAEDVHEAENTFESSVVLGRGSRVTRSTLRDVVLFEGCEIEDCVLENCIVDNDCILRGVDLTGKMLRAGTRLRKT